MVDITMKRFPRLFLILSGLLFGSSGSLHSAYAQDRAQVSDVRIGYDGDLTRVVINASEDLDYSQFALSGGGLRYVLDFDRLDWSIGGQNKSSGEGDGAGGIQRFRFAHNSATTSRIVFDLDEPLLLESAFTLEPAQGDNVYRIVIDFRETDMDTFKSVRPVPVTATNVKGDVPQIFASNQTSENIVADSKQPPMPFEKRHMVVIDAGHGGHDPGALGLQGTKEKDVNLRAALKLRDILVKSGNYDIILTRETDVIVDFDDRISIARDAEADIFISIHADAAGNRAVAGASVYTLSTAGDDRRENMRRQKGWDIPLEVEPPGEAVTSILEDLVTRETQNKSAEFASVLIPELEDVGPVLRNSHRQGNLYVLLAPDVPAVLLEIGFLTNPNDEARLSSGTGINRTMEAVHRAIDLYFDQQDRIYAQY